MADPKKLIPKRFTAIEARKMILSLQSDEAGTDDRNKDKKSRTKCQKCGSFACTGHMVSICKRCA